MTAAIRPSPLRVLIACHAGATIGLGHLARALVLARALRDQLGAAVELLIQGDVVERPDLQAFSHRFIRMEADLAAAITQACQEAGTQLMVMDLHPQYHPSDLAATLAALRRHGCRCIGVDTHQQTELLDLLFIPSFRTPPGASPDGTPPVLSGWDCFLLGVPPPTRTSWRPDSDVLVLTGGSDPTGLGKTLPAQLNDRLAAKTRIDWVSGPYAAPPSFPSMPRVSFVQHRAPPCLDNLMDRASYALAVYGVSFYELLYYGVPTVVFSPYGDKDDAELAIVEAEGVALTARNAEEAVERLHMLMQDEALAQRLSQRARARMAARGEEKFIHVVATLMGEA